MKAVVTSINLRTEGDVTHARRVARLIAKSCAAPSHDQIRFATAVSEITRNAVQYGRDGLVEFAFESEAETRRLRLVARVEDRGDGIVGVDAFLKETGAVKGAGQGLRGSRRLLDDLVVDTSEAGTLVDLVLVITSRHTPGVLAEEAAAALVEASRASPVDELTEQNRALRDALGQHQLLIREMHHRTKNNLAIIQSLALMQARQADHPATEIALNSLAGRIQAFANAHNLLHQSDDIARIDMREHILSLGERLRGAFDPSAVILEAESDSVMVTLDLGTEIGLVVNELVTNAVKHAGRAEGGPRHVEIVARREASGIRITVADDGPGLADAEATLRKSRSMGWRIIEASMRKLNGSIVVDGTNGLSVTMTFPLRAYPDGA